MRSFLADLRYGLRGLRKNPGFAVPAAATLALGIGATVAIFGVVDAVLLKALPYREPGRLARVGSLHPVKNSNGIGASYMDLRDWRDRNRSFDKLSGILGTSVVLGGSESAAQVDAAFVSADLLPLLGLEPVAGRNFRPDEDREGGPSRVVLLSESVWKSRFGGDRAVVGRKILIDGGPYEVIGVAPDDALVIGAGVIAPLVNQAFPSRSGRAVDVVGRLAPGVTLAAARRDMESIGRALASEYPEENTGFSIAVQPLQESLVGGRRPALLVLSGAVALLLLIACANTANLLLTRGASRRHELAVRAALGAGRGRLARQLFAEASALASIGGAGGLAAGSFLLAAIRRLAAGSVPRIETATLDGRAFLFALAASAATALLFGIVPAALTSGRAMTEGLRLSARGGAGSSRALDGLVLFQTALCLVLLVGAGLLGGSYLRLARTSPGFSAERVLSVSLSLPRAAYREQAPRNAVLERLIGRVASLPGVRAAGLIGWLPAGQSMTISYTPEGHPKLSRAQSPQGELREVSAGTFAALGIPILAGRGIRESDRADARPVIVVNRNLAAKLWPGQPAVGRHITLFADRVEREVVGVAGDVRRMDQGAATTDQIYVPFAQDPLFIRMSAVVRSDGEPSALAASIEKAVAGIDPGIAVSDGKTMEQVISGSVAEPRFRTILVGFFAAAALLLASVGLYGVTAYTVTRRRYEIGVRMAMGATPAGVLRLFVGAGLRRAGAGVAAGVLAAAAATRLLTGLLSGIRPTDPATFAAAALLLLVVASLASFVPARRAAATEPLAALRSE
ncbi:MAG TPA: ABC transporter permease [Thermoanaerobaculia bacterium]|nr:ABC transporter permease [Thermoanaerobaculia bacterium]